MDNASKKNLQTEALKVRMGVVEGTFQAGSGHPGGSLSIADILTYLYFYKMKVDPKNPRWDQRDRFVLSKGHAAPALYAALAGKGFFPEDELPRLRKVGSMLQGHPDMKNIPGVDMSTGSLGQGISAACGMALSAKHFGEGYRVYCALGDGECEEGQVWEAAMFAAHKRLDNLIVFVDLNHLQIDGSIEEVNSPLPLDEKFAAFQWHVVTVDGHDFDALDAAVEEALTVKGKPTAIICNTVKGKGVSFMENVCGWHGVAPKKDEYEKAMDELKARLAALEA
ncbi:MAG: transketolase [Clostridiales bacterium]|nr:transketolase [Clostridiales bacterium]